MKKGSPRLALQDTAHMGFMRCGGGSETNVFSLPPGKNITYGALQNTRFQAADRPKTQRHTLTARQERGLQYLYTGTVYYSLEWNVTRKFDKKKPQKNSRSWMGVM